MAFITLTINDNVIETRFFPDRHIAIAGYLQGLKLDMLEQNDDFLKSIPEKPVFNVEISPKRIIRN